MSQIENIMDLLTDKNIFNSFKNDIFPLIKNKIKNFHGYGCIYIDFENLWYSILVIEESFINPKEITKEIEQNLINKLKEILNKLINFLNKTYFTEIRFIKAYADFANLFLADKLKIINILRSMGIETITSYVRGSKDMSDRALIIGVIEDLLHENENLSKVFILTGDIDFYPLFEFMSKNYTKDFFVVSFENRLNSKYREIFFLKDKIIDLDNILNDVLNGKKSRELEEEKKKLAIENHVKRNKLDKNKPIDFKKTLEALHKHYPYLRFQKKDLEKFGFKDRV